MCVCMNVKPLLCVASVPCVIGNPAYMYGTVGDVHVHVCVPIAFSCLDSTDMQTNTSITHDRWY